MAELSCEYDKKITRKEHPQLTYMYLHASQRIPEWMNKLHRHIAADIIGPWMVVTEMQPPRILERIVELEASGRERCRDVVMAGKLPAMMPSGQCHVTIAACFGSMWDLIFAMRACAMCE
jgi:hypothetical protein